MEQKYCITKIQCVNLSNVVDDEMFEVFRLYFGCDIKRFASLYGIKIEKNMQLANSLRAKHLPIYMEVEMPGSKLIYTFQFIQFLHNENDEFMKDLLDRIYGRFNYFINFIKVSPIEGRLEQLVTYVTDKGRIAVDLTENSYIAKGSYIVSHASEIFKACDILNREIFQDCNRVGIYPYIYINV